MLYFIGDGDIFSTYYDYLVNPVNCVGVMGKGLALEFKKRYPKNFDYYYKTVYDLFGKMYAGIIIKYDPQIIGEPIILNIATKFHYRNNSRIEWIERGLLNLSDMFNKRYLGHTPTIGMPKLGCGLGGLDWNDVCPLYHKYLSNIFADIYVYGKDTIKQGVVSL